MIRAVPVFVAGLFIALLAACAAPGNETQAAATRAQPESPQQATRQGKREDDCEETTGSRFKRCPGSSSGSGMVTGGAVTPGTAMPHNSKSN